jgi:hypothetical protein
MNISQLIDKAWEAINSKSLSEAYLIMDQVEDKIVNLKIIKPKKEKELEELIKRKKEAVLKPPTSG